MPSHKEKEVLLSLVTKYKCMPHLWQKDHQNYLKQEVRNESYVELLNIYKQFDETATVKTLKKKIENMRSGYAKELKKVLEAKYTGGEYVPTLWYFDSFRFLDSVHGLTEIRPTKTRFEEVNSPSHDITASVADPLASSCCQPKRMKPDLLIEKQESINLSTEDNTPPNDEECEAYGRAIGFQMRDLNRRQLTISQKMISDIIFYAKLNQLSECSYVVTKPPDQSTPANSSFHQRQNQCKSSPPSNNSSP